MIDSGSALSTPVNSPSASAPAMTPGWIDNYVYSSYKIGRANPYAPKRIVQYEYKPQSMSFRRHPPVEFMVNGYIGINAKRALDNEMSGLNGHGDLVFVS
ncbi:hypothetical protein WOLCODRAFT_165652 [Wolfiporia cocos MD-104 SS10]|uniref:Uncharacterized protein n=1 Tax=Wolfiporia cocos (strain MD-104) TaxID=742152 RepID=A0A2H3J444_WOLCO|nr:hypothetical protein WOLCODRAFT_165652 [Wolfiporia cocos MD-104 SS10]